MQQFIYFMMGPWGRLVRIVLGLALIAYGLTVLGGTTWFVLAAVGLVPLGLGLSGRCVLEPFARRQPRTYCFSKRKPSVSLQNPLKRSTTAINSSSASSSSPSFCTAEVCTPSQYSQLFTADTATAMISFVKRSSFPCLTMNALSLDQFAAGKR